MTFKLLNMQLQQTRKEDGNVNLLHVCARLPFTEIILINRNVR